MARLCKYILAAFSLVVLPRVLAAQIAISDKEWNEDLVYLKEQILKTIPAVDENKLATDFDLLKIDFEKSNNSQKLMAIQKFLAGLNDEGNKLLPIQDAFDNAILPIKTYWFEDGLYVLDAIEQNKALINQKITAINGVEIDTLYKIIAPYLSADNDNYLKYLYPFYVQNGLWLKGSGVLAENANEVSITTEKEKTITVSFSDYSTYSQLKRELVGNTSDQNYWKSYDAITKTLTVQFQAIIDNEKGDNFSKFIKGIAKDLDSKKVDKLIIDNRFGGGGNGFKLKSFTDIVRDNESINQRGKLFVLTSRATRGTVMELTSILELNTKAVIIGEGTGEGPNSVGDIKVFELPNSKVKISLTHKFWPTTWSTDNRKELSPVVETSYTSEKHLNKIDPWLVAISTFKAEENYSKIPSELLKQLPGKYKVGENNITIEENNGRLFLYMNRKMMSFFEIHSELYFKEDGELTTDIDGVVLRYNTANQKPKQLSWKGKTLTFQ
ncbi:MAG: hypothetical protein RLO81_11040 [Fulvivirga sp.]|uniref:hypothetical protein n=1 Tax=Fulvivirga sp. TaxID=1931237 RepID=UPI0032EBE44E